jgi:hypothetical protein
LTDIELRHGAPRHSRHTPVHVDWPRQVAFDIVAHDSIRRFHFCYLKEL